VGYKNIKFQTVDLREDLLKVHYNMVKQVKEDTESLIVIEIILD
jgi:hypothetical protein